MRTPLMLLAAALAAATGFADQTPASARKGNVQRDAHNYYPLAVGNSWIYQGGGVYAGTFLTLQITQTQIFNGNQYFLLHGFSQQDYWVRQDGSGAVLAYDPSQNVEKPWWDFAFPLGQQYQTFLPGVCCGVATVSSRNTSYKGPIGQFSDALEITYPGVFQVGVAREDFLPGVGLVYRSQATGGPSVGSWELIYARVGSVSVHAASELSFGLTLDDSVYTVNMMPPVPSPPPAPVMTARITLRNTGQPVVLTFPSGQTFDLEIRNEQGAVVYRWSNGQAFTMIFRTLTFGPGEMDFPVQVRLAGSDKNPLPQGKYVAEAWLTTQGGKIYDATVGFEVRWLM